MSVFNSPFAYQRDILGEGYEQLKLSFPNDYEGAVCATLIRKKAPQPTRKAVLYIHGFIDYFFQTEMADQFNQQGYDFYALDLRKYGRSHLHHQKYYNVRTLSEYDAEITQALEIIASEDHLSIVLAGHSTGGLITTLYTARHPQHPHIKALWANSPFYDFNMHPIKRKFGLPQLSRLAKYFPNLEVPSELNPYYVSSLHQSEQGEWSFDLNWKKAHYPRVRIGFVRAIYQAQKPIHQGNIKLDVPTLIMHSHRTSNPKKWGTAVQNSDIILDVKDIQKQANKLQGKIRVVAIKNGLHDLVLSAPDVRAEVYRTLFCWLEQQNIEA